MKIRNLICGAFALAMTLSIAGFARAEKPAKPEKGDKKELTEAEKAAILEKYDANKNGKLDDDEKAKMKEDKKKEKKEKADTKKPA